MSTLPSSADVPGRTDAPFDPSFNAQPDITHSRLANGLELVVIPDRRTPVVTHMVWYRNGSADDPGLKSGIAHFLEHLMFKGTKNHAQGEFSNLISELGGQENAFTSYDYTCYFQRMPCEHLSTVMEYEADRMVNLALDPDAVAVERDVVLEERRMRVDSDPAAQLNEAVQSALFTHHPYGVPVLGWEHEIETFTREDALAYYDRFYTPENAIVVVAGDVEAPHVQRLAEEIYGKLAARRKPPIRQRPMEPPTRAHRLVTLHDDKVEQPAFERLYPAPSAITAAPGESEALEVIAHLFGGGQTSQLYRKLVLEKKVAVMAGAYYMATALDDTRIWFYAMPAAGVALEALDKAFDEVLADFLAAEPEARDLERAKTRLVADAIYAQDNQASLARWFGAALAIGETTERVKSWPDRIEKITGAHVLAVARKWLEKRNAVTGFLLQGENA